MGIYLDKRTRRWISRISIAGEERYLGAFQTRKEALQRSKEMRLKYPEKRRGGQEIKPNQELLARALAGLPI